MKVKSQNPFLFFFNCSGRLDRIGFLKRVIVLIFILILMGLILQRYIGFYFDLVFCIGVTVFCTASLICKSIERCHDLGKKGWLTLLYLTNIFFLPLLIYLLFAKGTEGENKYGPQPSNKN